jgi:hypothetical protein
MNLQLDGNLAVRFPDEILPPQRPSRMWAERGDDDDDDRPPLDRGAVWILIGIGVALGAIWTGFAWAIWSAFS